jgi:phosphoglycerol transferase MdoB-like AlkP superfamily enzyme
MQWVKSIVHSFLFLLLVFGFGRLIFLAWYFPLVANEGLSILIAFGKGLPLDISTASMIIGIPVLLSCVQWLFGANFLLLIQKRYVQLIIVLTALIVAGEIVMYDEWMMKLHYKIFVHLSNPSEVFYSAHGGHYFTFGAALLIMLLPLIFYNKLMAPNLKSLSMDTGLFIGIRGWSKRIGTWIGMITLLLLGVRGGWQPIPINQSHCYYSSNNVLNEAAVNPIWNLTHSILENKKNMGNTNIYDFYETDKAAEVFENIHQKTTSLYPQALDTLYANGILKNKQPNIVFLIMDSWSSDIIGSLGGMVGITPAFDSLAQRGLLFSNIYATGKTSDQGIPAILSSFHALPTTSIVAQPNKYRQLACTNASLAPAGYHSSFYFGGQLIYGNIKGYLFYHGFDEIIEQSNMDPDLPAGRLGIHDEYVMARHLKDLNKQEEPFFSSLFTLSTHPPYDMPLVGFKHYSEIENSYLNAAHYTDSCLGEYFKQAKKTSWYNNTLFVIVADHSHKTHKRHGFYSPAHFKIPLLFFGEPIELALRGKVVTKIGSQVDINATLLNQLDISYDEFAWSKDLLDPRTPGFAFYSWYDGYAWVTPQGHFAYENRFQKYFHLITDSSKTEDQMIMEGRSYLQHTFQKYLEY